MLSMVKKVKAASDMRAKMEGCAKEQGEGLQREKEKEREERVFSTACVLTVSSL